MSKPPERYRNAPDARSLAEAAFKSATVKPKPELPPAPVSLPGVKELVSLRVDRTILDYFQADGAGWQDRMVEALRMAAGMGA
jgi:uncharacterized protein (DUF4415 family)